LQQAQTRQQPAALAGLAKWKELLNNPLAARSNAAVGPQGLNLDPIQPAVACFAGVCCLSYITASQHNATDMVTSVAHVTIYIASDSFAAALYIGLGNTVSGADLKPKCCFEAQAHIIQGVKPSPASTG
jgi:hypothetical protein